jgi:hypothetical protein
MAEGSLWVTLFPQHQLARAVPTVKNCSYINLSRSDRLKTIFYGQRGYLSTGAF